MELGCFPWDEEHDAKGTNEMIMRALKLWDITQDQITYVHTDNASVMVAAIRAWESATCGFETHCTSFLYQNC